VNIRGTPVIVESSQVDWSIKLWRNHHTMIPDMHAFLRSGCTTPVMRCIAPA